MKCPICNNELIYKDNHNNKKDFDIHIIRLKTCTICNIDFITKEYIINEIKQNNKK